MRTYVIVSFLEEDFPRTFLSEKCPLHVTIVRHFSSSENVATLLNILNDFCFGQKELITYGKSREMFGADKNVSVTELENTEELAKLHKDLHEKIKDVTELVGLQYDSYRPHVSDHGETCISIGEKVPVSSLSLVEMIENKRRGVYFLSLNKL